MEFVDGTNLEDYLERQRKGKKATYPEILSIIRDIAIAMDYIHEQNVLHLDLRCANVMVMIINGHPYHIDLFHSCFLTILLF